MDAAFILVASGVLFAASFVARLVLLYLRERPLPRRTIYDVLAETEAKGRHPAFRSRYGSSTEANGLWSRPADEEA